MSTELMHAEPGLLPEAAITEAQLVIISQQTPRDAVRWRQGKGGRQLAYVDHAYVTRLLNEAFGWDWDFEVDNEEILYAGEQKRPFEVRCRGRLTVRAPGGRSIVKMQFGCQPIEMMKDGSLPVSLGDAYKGAASDALKKCASLLGIALDLYDSDSPSTQPQAQQRRPELASYQPPRPAPQPATNGAEAADARAKFYAKWSPVAGTTWAMVSAYAQISGAEPTTVEGWRTAWRIVQKRADDAELDAIEGK